jgi:hypothetical protein
MKENWESRENIIGISIGDPIRINKAGIKSHRRFNSSEMVEEEEDIIESYDESIEYEIVGITDGSGTSYEEAKTKYDDTFRNKYEPSCNTWFDVFNKRGPHYLGIEKEWSYDDDYGKGTNTKLWYQTSHWYFLTKSSLRNRKINSLL